MCCTEYSSRKNKNNFVEVLYYYMDCVYLNKEINIPLHVNTLYVLFLIFIIILSKKELIVAYNTALSENDC